MHSEREREREREKKFTINNNVLKILFVAATLI